jgi:hypothetical protein
MASNDLTYICGEYRERNVTFDFNRRSALSGSGARFWLSIGKLPQILHKVPTISLPPPSAAYPDFVAEDSWVPQDAYQDAYFFHSYLDQQGHAAIKFRHLDKELTTCSLHPLPLLFQDLIRESFRFDHTIILSQPPLLGMSLNSSSTLASCTGLGPNVDSDGDNPRLLNTADSITIPMVFGVIGVVLTLATIIIGIIQIQIAWKHQRKTANCRADLELAVELSPPSSDTTAASSLYVAVHKTISESHVNSY